MTIKNSACLLLLCSVLCLLSAQEPPINLAVPLTQDVIDKIPVEHVAQFAQFDNQSLVQGSFAQVHPAVALLDTHDPSRYTLIKSAGPYVFLAGTPTESDLQVILTWLDEHAFVLLLCDLVLQPFFLEHGFTLQPWIAFTPPASEIRPLAECPPGYCVHRIDDAALLSRCLWADAAIRWYGSVERFLQHGFGFVLMSDAGDIAAEIYAAFMGNQSCEIGIVTDVLHQKRGYAALMARCLMQECHSRSIVPLWSCRADNMASMKTALKNGFTVEHEYVFLKKGDW